MKKSYTRFLERLAWTVGGLLLVFYLAVRVHGVAGKRAALDDFESARVQVATTALSAAPETGGGAVDTTLWAEGRIEAYEESLAMDLGQTLGILRIPKIRLEVPVLEGTDEPTLNRAVGRIVGTAGLEGGGNLGLAGHRDGFFRGLKDVELGDALELETLRETRSYRIDSISIVTPEDVYVLDPTPEPAVTLGAQTGACPLQNGGNWGLGSVFSRPPLCSSPGSPPFPPCFEGCP